MKSFLCESPLEIRVTVYFSRSFIIMTTCGNEFSIKKYVKSIYNITPHSITSREYMTTIHDIYNISTSGEEEAAYFTFCLFSYFINKRKSIFPDAKDAEWINGCIDWNSQYECCDLSEEERERRQALADFVANSYFTFGEDLTYSVCLIAFCLRRDLRLAVDYVRHQAEKLNVGKILFQSNATDNECTDETLQSLRRDNIYIYETKEGEKVFMQVWAGSLWQDDYNRYTDNNIKEFEQDFRGYYQVDWFVDYFVNLDVVRVKNLCNNEVLQYFPEELLVK